MIKSTISFLLIIAFVLTSSLSFAPGVSAQVRPVNDYGAMGLGQMLRRLQTTASVLMIGAHPDDEDSALLAYLARGENARTAYLSLTRGDGGQNIIGPELFEALGVIRTEELLQARRLDGAEQFFTTAYDYGFSKTLAEAKQKWPEDVIKCEVVDVIRKFRPLVVISRFSGTPADGHGQHQYAGYISPLAVKAAADPKACGGGDVWQVRKFYVEQGFSANNPSALQMNTGTYDPLFGRTYFEIAMEGRSQHKSQGEGRLEFHGPSYSGLNLIETTGEKLPKETSPFDGIDVSVSGAARTFTQDVSKIDPQVVPKLAALQEILSSTAKNYNPTGTSAATPTLAGLVDARKILDSLDENYRVFDTHQMERGIRNDAGLWTLLAQKYQELDRAIVMAAGIQVDALSDRETIANGEDVTLAVKTYFPSNRNVSVKDVRVFATCHDVDSGGCSGATFEPVDQSKLPQQSIFRRETANDARFFTAHVKNLPVTEPYWLRAERLNDLFRLERMQPGEAGMPFSPPPLMAELTLNVSGVDVRIARPVEYRYADAARGEIRRELNIVRSITVDADRDLMIVPTTDRPQKRTVTITLTNNSSQPAHGNLVLDASELAPSPAKAPFELKGKNDSVRISFDLTVPAKQAGAKYRIFPRIESKYNQAEYAMHVISYPHIQTHRFYTATQTDVSVIDLKTVPLNVGYIMGSGDDVPDAIREMGMNVTLLDEKALASGDLSKYDTIVVGIRASETRPDFVANNKRLLDYVNAGGNLIVQYQRGNFANSGLLPYPADAQDKQRTAAGSIARVVDENAPVQILQPQNPIFNFPNKITEDDFKGWVQERNAYNLVTFDSKYTPLLESHDVGEQPNNGGMVFANLGKGTYIYTSYSWFRQLPAGVPGAYRIFANLLSLPKAAVKKP